MGAGYAMWTRVKQLVRGQVSMKLSVGTRANRRGAVVMG